MTSHTSMESSQDVRELKQHWEEKGWMSPAGPAGVLMGGVGEMLGK
jgi:hypothetical protein